MAEPTKILIIDDSEDDRFLYRRVLRSGGSREYEIVERDNGEDGFVCIENERPDCILLDYSLPGHNGIEVLKRIRCAYPFVAIVMLTGQGNETVAVAAMQEGAQHYIAKSTITSETLQRTVRASIEHCTLQQHVQEQRVSLEMFTRALAHDLKEPIRTIRSFLELIANQNLTPEKNRQYFDYIVQAAERMNALIDTVYFYIRLENATQTIAQEACDSNQAVENAKENLNALIHDHKAVITVDPLPLVLANRMQLIQIMQNLISNAIQHCGDIPRIHISAAKNGENWRFCVADNGPGIAEEYRKKIFEPFKRLVRHKEDGLGLGLAICKKIIESAGGKIWCESQPGAGSSFFFTLADAVPAHMPSSLSASPQQSAKTNFLDEDMADLANILIVEDSEADIELVRFALIDEHKLHCRLFVTHNGHEALLHMKEKMDSDSPIDLVLLDINMPGMDGFEFLTQMRATRKLIYVPVVMCTTSNHDKDVEQAKNLGALAYLLKPLDFNKLKPVIQTISRLNLLRSEDGYMLMRAVG